MKSNIFRTLLVMTFVLVFVVTASFASSAEMVLRMGRITEPEGFCPHTIGGRVAREVSAPLYENLIWGDDDGNFHPWVASGWETSDDFTEITFFIREGINFHDGTPLNAEAVKFNLERANQPGNFSADHFPNMTIEVVEEYTVKINLEETYAPFFHNLASRSGGLVSPTAVEKHGGNFYLNPVGSGPFMFESHTLGAQVVFVKNPDYVSYHPAVENPGPPHVDRLIYEAIPEETTRSAALTTGGVNIIETGAVAAMTLRDHPLVYQLDSRAINHNRIGFNMQRPPFDDKLVRMAVAYAVDIEELGQVAFFDQFTPNRTFIPVDVPGYNAQLGEEYGYFQDQAKAIELLNEAGYERGSDGIMRKDGQPLEVTLLTHYAMFTERAAEAIQSQLAEVGIRVNISLMDVGTFLTRGAESETNHFFLIRMTWSDPILLDTLFLDGGQFDSHTDPVLDEMLIRAGKEMDWEKRKEILDEIQIYLLENAFAVPICSNDVIWFARNEVTGLKFDTQNTMILNDVKVGE